MSCMHCRSYTPSPDVFTYYGRCPWGTCGNPKCPSNTRLHATGEAVMHEDDHCEHYAPTWRYELAELGCALVLIPLGSVPARLDHLSLRKLTLAMGLWASALASILIYHL